MAEQHLSHLTVANALAADCYYGECEHVDELGEPSDYSACPSLSMEVCVDCMVERGQGSDPNYWEDGLVAWPHGTVDIPKPRALSSVDMLKPPPEYVRCSHGYDHHAGPHTCDGCVVGECAHWAWTLDHRAAVDRLNRSIQRNEK